MRIDDISTLLEKYQKGICTPEERRIIDEWYDSLQLGEETALPESAIDNSLAKIRSHLQELTGETAPDISTDRPATPGTVFDASAMMTAGRFKGRWWMAAAAASLILLTSGFWLLFSGRGREVNKLAFFDKSDSIATVITGRGETRQIVLSDGSSIELNAGTEITYPKHFSGNTRDIKLIKGEAFFQIAANPARPFTVSAGGAKTTVLGTSFDIRAYTQEGSVRIALLTGKIAVTTNAVKPGGIAPHAATPSAATPSAATPDRDDKTSILTPNQLISIDNRTGISSTSHFDNDYDVAAWKEGGIHFKDASFEDIAFEIGNKYNIELTNISSKQKWSYTGLFRNNSLQEAIETICMTENLSYKFTDNGILITNKNK
jgi:ferric-dicitrate binding protein FerR (iron transport regulator)